MITNILVALDDDNTCQRVFNQAVELAHPLHAHLHLLNVLMPERDDSVTQAPYSDKDRKMYTDRYREL